MYINMTKIISISDEAYGELKKLKNGKSFTEIIIELSKTKKRDIMDFVGILTKEEGEVILKEIKNKRKEGSRRMR